MTPQAVMDLHAQSFSWASRFLSASARHDAALLYVFARLADDLVDEEVMGSPFERMQQLQSLREGVLLPGPGSRLEHQVGRLLSNHGVSPAVVAHFIDCLEQDACQRHVQSTPELLKFAYGVAGTIGQMMCPILGAAADGQKHAIALGVAMQLTNIARDVVEDAARGRCYIPAQWGVSAKALAAPKDDLQAEQAFACIHKLLRLADDFYSYAQPGLSHIPAHNRRAILVAATLYRGIGQKILRRGSSRYWGGRVSLSKLEKLFLIASCAGTGSLRKGGPRDVLAQDLHHLSGVPGFPVRA